MALDVHLSREKSERWGFELMGGADEEMPITLEKIQPGSPAKRAGLQNGDTVLTINGEEAIDMSLETACRKVAECGESLTVGVMRGLYDPVLDDQEPIYDYEPEDLDPQSDPTEVSFKIQNFVDPSDLGSNLLEYGASPDLESRSLTASPFVTPTKPYRPFSTEPVIEVPPLEDPIILNPNYRDEFGKTPVDTDPDYILSAHFKNGVGNEGRYKLPISEQYDPDGKRIVQNVEVVDKLLKYEKHVKSLSNDLQVLDVTKETKVCEAVANAETISTDIKQEVSKDVQSKEKKVVITEDVEEKAINEELQYIEKMRQEIDLEKIEETALSLVDDSIERAVLVAEEIKKEIDEELSASETEQKSEKVVTEKREVSQSVKSETVQESSETVDESEVIKSEEQHKVAKDVTDIQDEKVKIEKKDVMEMREEFTEKDATEAVKRKSIISEEYQHEKTMEVPRRKVSSVHETTENKSEFRRTSKTETYGTNGRQKAQERVHAIGMQTIPNIRGAVHSSVHYDLLLRTFFIHLTDVMVVLSRFITHQPIFDDFANQQATESQRYEKDSKVRKSSEEIIETSRKQSSEESRVETKQERKEIIKPVPIRATKIETKDVSQKIEKDVKVESVEKKVERKEVVKPVVKEQKIEAQEKVQKVVEEQKVEKKTGAQMAQLSEKKLSQDMTQKMDAVISEFQTIAVEDEVKKEILQKGRRSSSRSQIEEEVMKESDPLEWLSKVDSRRASQERTEISKKEFSSSSTMERRESKFESKEEIKHKKPKTPKQTYLAIVESHVYTNKDAIFEEHVTDISETSSVQSAEEVNTALESIETITTENVALESAIRELETAKVVETSHELATVTAQSAATVQKVEEVMHDSKELVKEEIIQGTKLEAAVFEEEKAVESKVEVIEPKPVQIEEVTETVKVKIDKKPEISIHDEYAALKIVKQIETEIESTNEIIEIEEITDAALTSESVVNKIEMSKELEMDESQQLVQKSFVSKEFGLATEAKRGSVDVTHINSIDASSVSKSMEVSQHQSIASETVLSDSTVQESSFTAKSVDRKLSLRTDLDQQMSVQSEPSTIDTPTPSTVPPTPLTDEYVFKLSIPLPPRSRSATPVPRDSSLTPEDEDPHIVKKKLIPHIDVKAIERVIYDPPLPTPVGEKEPPVYTKPGLNGGGLKFRLPVYRKPGLFGGADRPEYSKEEIREIERKSSLLASAIDETIKSIEEYKEEVGIETKKEVKMQEYKEEKINKSYQESYTKEVKMESQNGFQETKIEEIIEKSDGAAIGTKKADESQTKQEEPKVVEVEIKKESIEADSSANTIENRRKSKEKTVKFDTEFQKIAVADNNMIEVERVAHTPEPILNAPAVDIEKEIASAIECNSLIVERVAHTPDPLIPASAPIFQPQMEVRDVKPTPAVEVNRTERVEDKSDALLGFRPVVFDPEAVQRRTGHPDEYITVPIPTEPERPPGPRMSPYLTETGEQIGTTQGIVDGLEEPVLNEELAKLLGKPGISEEKIAELISGEAEMLREAHVMGLSRVLTSHMHRADDSSVDFQKIKPMIDSLKDSEVLKALNEEIARQKEEEKKKEEKRWTTFLQKPKRPVPKAKFGYQGWTEDDHVVAEPYKVKIVKQAKPKVAPDYKPEDFETGPLPWEERAVLDASLPPVEPEEPILIPEVPEFLEAVDPLKESEVPDLEDTGIPLPPPREPTPPPIVEQPEPEPEVQETPEVTEVEEEKEEVKEDMDNRLAEQLVRSVQGMVDPNASVEQQLQQMRAQLAALAQLPEVIQQTLDLVSKQLCNMVKHEDQPEPEKYHEPEVIENENQPEMQTIQEGNENDAEGNVTIEEVEEKQVMKQEMRQQVNEEQQNMGMTPMISEEELRMEKQRKEQAQLEHESRLVKQHPTPRATKPKRVFGPLDPEERNVVVLPGGRRWRNTDDVYDEQKIAEMFEAHSELIQGKAIGFESVHLPYDSRINFMKYEKPPVSLDHLKHSEVYKLVHDMDMAPPKRVEMRTPVMCEADYRERCRSMTPSVDKKHLHIPQQFHP